MVEHTNRSTSHQNGLGARLLQRAHEIALSVTTLAPSTKPQAIGDLLLFLQAALSIKS